MSHHGTQRNSESQQYTTIGVAVLLASLAMSSLLAQKPTPEQGTSPVSTIAAVVDGEPITVEDVDSYLAAKLVRVRSEEYQLRERGLNEMIEKRIVEREAIRRGTTADALLRQATADALGEIRVQAVKVYRAFPGRFSAQSESDAITEISGGLAAQRAAEIKAQVLKDANVVVERRLQPYRIAMAPGGAATLGATDAPVEIVEFSDFQCPFCARASATVRQVLEAYKDKVRLTFRHYPLNAIHKDAAKAAEAASCAGDQGKFWQMHDRLFANQQALQVSELKKKAAELGLDGVTFETCLDGGRHSATWKGDLRAGQDYGVAGTPTFFVNGRLVPGAATSETLGGLIDQELALRAGAMARSER